MKARATNMVWLSWRPWVAGLRARGQLRLQRARDEREKGVGRLLGLAALGAGVAAFVLVIAFAGGFYARLQDARELGRVAIAFSLLGLMTALVLSSLGHAATAFFASQDLWYWDSAPAPPWSRFLDRLSETFLGAVPATLFLGALAIAGLLLGLGATPLALTRALLAVTLVSMIPVGVGISAAHLGGAILPAGRLRRISLLAIGIGTFFLLAWLRSARLETVVTVEGAAAFLDQARSVEEIGAWWWPHNVGSAFVLSGDIVAFLVLIAWSIGSLVLALFLHLSLYHRCRDRAADESPAGLKRGSRTERALFWLVRLLPFDLRAVALKDVLTFTRDPSQWSQLILLVGIAGIYAVNCRALMSGFERMVFVREVILVGLHVGIVSFISAGLAARFAFTQAGLEGFSVWMVEASPLPSRRMLIAKFWATVPLVALFPVVVAAVGGLVLELSPMTFVLSTLTVALTSCGLVGIGVGKGAVAPVLDAASVAELSLGPGALISMATTMGLCALSAIATSVSASMLFFRPDWKWFLTAVVLSLGVSGMTLAYGWRVLLAGADAFERRKLEGTAGAPTVALKQEAQKSR